MKSILILCAVATLAVSLSSCGECSCNSYNKDYLRDVPVHRSSSF